MLTQLCNVCRNLFQYKAVFLPFFRQTCLVQNVQYLVDLFFMYTNVPKEDILYLYRSIGTPPPPSSSSIATTFPCLYNCSVCCILQQLSVCITAKNPQNRYTDREKESQLMMTGGAYASTRIYLLWTIPLINEIFQTLL